MSWRMSTLPKTWLFDIDGTLVKHNGYKFGGDILLEGVANVFAKIPPEDKIILLTARKKAYKEETEAFLHANNIRFDQVIYDLPIGERIIINDDKPSGLCMGYAVNKKRDEAMNLDYILDGKL